MAGLIDELGAQYCNQMVVGALFMYNDHPHMLTGVQPDVNGTNTVLATKYPKSPHPKHAHESKGVNIPSDHFVGWKSLAFPTLGYRAAENGMVLAYLTRQNSVRRGLNLNDVHFNYHDVLRSAQDRFNVDVYHYQETEAGRIPMIMCPEYTPLMRGLKDVMDGKIASFAISADFACAPAMDVEFLEILYRRRRIGTISENGTINIDAASMAPSWNDATERGNTA